MVTERTKAGDAATHLLLTTFRLNGAFLGAADRISAPTGLTAARWQVLGSIMPADKPVAQIAREMGLTRQSVQRIANILAEEGMIAFAPNPAHQRAKLVVATKRGRQTMHTLTEVQHVWANATSAGFEAEDIERCCALMRQIADRLDDMA